MRKKTKLSLSFPDFILFPFRIFSRFVVEIFVAIAAIWITSGVKDERVFWGLMVFFLTFLIGKNLTRTSQPKEPGNHDGMRDSGDSG